MSETEKHHPKQIALFKHYSLHYSQGRGLYWLIIVVVLGILASLPFLFVDVTVQSSGVIRAITEPYSISSPVTAKIDKLAVQEHVSVKKGDTLVWFNHDAVDREIDLLLQQKQKYDVFISDLHSLLRSNSDKKLLKSDLLRKEQQEYIGKKLALNRKIEKLKVSYDRSSKLFTEQVISRVEFEKDSFELAFANDAVSEFEKEFKNKWQSEIQNYQERIQDIEAKTGNLRQDKLIYVIVSPVDGVVIRFPGLAPGGFAIENHELLLISPEESIIAECYVAPNDIGLIRDSMQVRMQIDAFNYNQWGLLNASVMSIGEDVIQYKGDFYFRVKCRLNQEYLMLDDGTKGELKKGMSLVGRFVVNRRSLFQLLFDNVTDWLNPKVHTRI